ncbi:NAD(P)-binding protein [Punctularia strigosozonata HHB-11173 SS5]|uniref:NAD(P)-binding protein n=1 Tax=Punctularia strigosozonata (strain HHB-11173) TaxID=741275 RepID=UPI0004417989|nr:NAD(P)-binding protein [Punctularia strigosozonata HHB-11173 SS5]EIN07152.1 NAD(P)-binding protein [Punctularia strigosozonata HHB-11173 SS5]
MASIVARARALATPTSTVAATFARPSWTRSTAPRILRHARTYATAKQPKTLPEFSLEGKVCLVTGAARGLGNEFCRAFVNSGCTSLVVVDLKQSEADAAAEELVNAACVNSDLKPSDFNVIGLECDVSSELSVQKAFQATLDKFGRVDSVVASAGIVENYAAFDYPFDRIKRLFDINVHGAFFTAREAARIMIPRGGGSVVLVASMSASIVNIPQPQTPYNAAKAAVRHMASSLAVEWAKKAVRVNTLSPGYMLTKLTRTILTHDPELKRTWESLTPMGRMGEPEDLAGAVVFLASDASRFMTGTEIRVDGGYCII